MKKKGLYLFKGKLENQLREQTTILLFYGIISIEYLSIFKYNTRHHRSLERN